MRFRATEKDVFIAGWLEGQSEYREAHRLWREHRRREFAFEVTPEYIKSLEPVLGPPPYKFEYITFADESEAADWYRYHRNGLYDPFEGALRYQGHVLCEEKGFTEQAKAAWNECRGEIKATRDMPDYDREL